MAHPTWTDQLAAIADLLLGVAYADGSFDTAEEAEIRKTLGLFGRIDGLSQVVEQRIASFDASTFDLQVAAAAVKFNGRSDRRVLLELIRDVLDADEIRDQHETSYFFAAAEALGIADLADSVLDGGDGGRDDDVRIDDYD